MEKNKCRLNCSYINWEVHTRLRRRLRRRVKWGSAYGVSYDVDLTHKYNSHVIAPLVMCYMVVVFTVCC